jgi:prevent-host-death family protein
VTEIGAFDAKTHLAELLERASAGEDIVITKRGRPVARLTGLGSSDAEDAFAELARLRKRTKLGGLSAKVLRDEGRR